jgi:peptide methionine sulfoxide reductase msrA/msrB
MKLITLYTIDSRHGTMTAKTFSSILISLILIHGCAKMETKTQAMDNRIVPRQTTGLETATFAAGCFWCMVAPFESLDGVKEVVSGYSGGRVAHPSYEDVSSGSTGHLESIQIVFDPEVISFSELLDIYWKQFDPTDSGGSFHDRGSQYLSAIFYRSDDQKTAAEQSEERLRKSGIFPRPLATRIVKFDDFYPAEDYHQDYHTKNPIRYSAYRQASGRDRFILSLWGDEGVDRLGKPDKVELEKKLTALQYNVTQKGATETPFDNSYWNNSSPGLYVDIVSGEPLFASRDKFDAGTGWPSFTKPVDTRYIRKKKESAKEGVKIEVRSRFADSHLGYVSHDGPSPSHLRYSVNSASLRFLPKEKLESEGYKNFLWLFR